MSQKRRGLASYFILSLLLIALVFFFWENKSLKSQMHSLQLQVAQQDQATDSIRSKGLTDLMCHVLNKVDTELNEKPSKSLSDETISRIAALSFSSKPYLLVENDSMGTSLLSPERGQLLLMLMRMNLDTSSLDKILLRSTFESADLRKADLRKAYLKGISMNAADLEDANLQDANLKKANLKSCNLWGAYLENAQLQEADLKRADLSWSDLDHAHMQKAILSGAKLHSVQMRNVDGREAVFRWADLSGSFVLNSDLSGADLTGANFTRSILNESNLKGSIVLRTNFTNTELTDVGISDTAWIERLGEWLITGSAQIAKKYTLSDDHPDKEQYYLRLKE